MVRWAGAEVGGSLSGCSVGFDDFSPRQFHVQFVRISVIIDSIDHMLKHINSFLAFMPRGF